MNKNEKIKRINKSLENTMTSVIGIEVTDIGEDYICGKMPVDNRTKQPFGVLHGGSSLAFAETLGSVIGGMKVPSHQNVMGIEINANHLKTVKEGYVYGKAVPVRIGNKIQVWGINITDEGNDLVCTSRLTLVVVEKR